MVRPSRVTASSTRMGSAALGPRRHKVRRTSARVPVAAWAACPERVIDGSLSSLAPIFSVALATHTPRYAFFAGLATAIGAGVSMSFSEGLSDTGEDTGRGNPRVRGAITGAGTFIGGFLHTLPFLIPSFTTALVVAVLVVLFELGTLAFLRMRLFNTSFATSLLNVALAGVIIASASAALGSAAG
jgi:erythrin-vacuolar iron transport family protein